MPDEMTRETNMLRIYDPHDQHTFVDVKVIRNIHFKDPHEGNQEYVYRFNNQQNGNGKDNQRLTRVQEVIGTDHSSRVEVERIKAWGVTNPQDNNQQTGFRMLPDLSDDDPPVPFKYHDVKIHNPHQHDVWVVMRRRDYTHLLDPKAGPSNNDSAIPASGAIGTDQTGGWASQDKYFKLTWADDDEHNPDHEVDTGQHSSDVNGPHGPYRFDPFQDLIDVHWGHSHGHLPHHKTPVGGCSFYPCIGGFGFEVASATDTNIGGIDFVASALAQLQFIAANQAWTVAGVIGVSPGQQIVFSPGCPGKKDQRNSGCAGPDGLLVTVPDTCLQSGIILEIAPPAFLIYILIYSYCELCSDDIGTLPPSPPNIFAAVNTLVSANQPKIKDGTTGNTITNLKPGHF